MKPIQGIELVGAAVDPVCPYICAPTTFLQEDFLNSPTNLATLFAVASGCVVGLRHGGADPLFLAHPLSVGGAPPKEANENTMFAHCMPKYTYWRAIHTATRLQTNQRQRMRAVHMTLRCTRYPANGQHRIPVDLQQDTIDPCIH